MNIQNLEQTFGEKIRPWLAEVISELNVKSKMEDVG